MFAFWVFPVVWLASSFVTPRIAVDLQERRRNARRQ
jgi:hypothetical protein